MFHELNTTRPRTLDSCGCLGADGRCAPSGQGEEPRFCARWPTEWVVGEPPARCAEMVSSEPHFAGGSPTALLLATTFFSHSPKCLPPAVPWAGSPPPSPLNPFLR